MVTTEAPERGELVDSGRPARRKAWVFPAAVLLLVAVLGTLRLSGSSLGVYATWAGVDEEEAGILAGPARGIRSDEWAVRTPWLLGQSQLGLPERTPGGVGVHDMAVIADLPTRSWELLLRPHTAGYAVLDAERAFALEWWLMAAVQLLGVYTLLYALTRRPMVSALSASLLTLSPATQWWWVPNAFTAIGYCCFAAVLLLFAHRADDRRRKVAWSIAAGWAAAAFLTALYPPWQIGAVIVVAPVGVAAIAPDLFLPETRRRALRSLVLVTGVSLGVAGLLFGSFLAAHGEAIRVIAATEYPGKQPANTGGTASLAVLWGSAYDYFSARHLDNNVDINGTNQSENSSALLLVLPVGLACYALGSAGELRGRRLAPPLLACLGGATVLLAWMLLPLPEDIGRLGLLTRAPPRRLSLPLGFAGVLALGLFVSMQLDAGRRLAWPAVAVSVGAFAAGLSWGAGAYRVNGSPIDLSTALLFAVVVSAGVALAYGRRPTVGLAVLVAFALWQASFVNPVQRGTGPITASPLRHAIDEAKRSAPTGTGWVVFQGDATIKGILTASGVNHVTGVSPYPDRDAWRVLDPELRYRHVWNRYAHVVFVPGAAGSQTSFELIAPDKLSVTVDPCSLALAQLDVGFFVAQNAELTACAEIVTKVPLGSGFVAIYRRVPSA
jgi:hypothetical protein